MTAALCLLMAVTFPPAPSSTSQIQPGGVASGARFRDRPEVTSPDRFLAYAKPSGRSEQTGCSLRLRPDGRTIAGEFVNQEGNLRAIKVYLATAVYQGQKRITDEVHAQRAPDRHRLRALAQVEGCEDARCCPPRQIFAEATFIVSKSSFPGDQAL